jgi:hypothetical protein
MCKYMHSEKECGHPSQTFHQDNAKENMTLITTAKGKDWVLAFAVKFTARKTPQQNSKAKWR